jgi:hypothetical protein
VGSGKGERKRVASKKGLIYEEITKKKARKRGK